MEISNLQQEYLFIYLSNTSSFLIKLRQLGDIWLFNCFEGCQHALARKKIKISQIKKIIITDNNIKNVSGLLGLLSSISLNTQTDRIDIYGPKGLNKYVFCGRKYSQTNFRYKLYIHAVIDGLIAKQLNFGIYAFKHNYKDSLVNYIFLLSEEPGTFNSINAVKYQIPFGPLYGYFKAGKNFILPDGSISRSKNFIFGYYLGCKVFFINRRIKKGAIKMLYDYTFLLYY